VCGGHRFKRSGVWADTCEGDSGGPLVVPVVSPESGLTDNAANPTDRDVLVRYALGGAASALLCVLLAACRPAGPAALFFFSAQFFFFF
jgi:hypothetical protein